MARPSLPASASAVLGDGPVTFGPRWLWEKEEGHFCSLPSAFLGDGMGRSDKSPRKRYLVRARDFGGSRPYSSPSVSAGLYPLFIWKVPRDACTSLY